MAPIGHVYMFLGLENGTWSPTHGKIDDGVTGAIIDSGSCTLHTRGFL